MAYRWDTGTFGKITKFYVDLLISAPPTPLVPLVDAVTQRAGISLYMKRDDLIHPEVSGNKWRKLKYALADARKRGFTTLLTFGGARSNHLYATAAAGAQLGMRTIGIVRGEEYSHKDTTTLSFCRAQGMEIFPVSRTEYRQKHQSDYLAEISSRFNNPYIIPEGGSTPWALPGVREMVEETIMQLGEAPDFFAVPAGTGGTAAGILAAQQRVMAFAALKGGDFLSQDILALAEDPEAAKRLTLIADYHFGGYARHTPALLQFMKQFEQKHQILVEQVYTGKMIFGLYDLIGKDYFKRGSTLVAVHTGGMQGRLPNA